MNEVRKIPLMRPLLPDFSLIEPYLKTIDENRWYSNFGPLVTSLEERLAEFFEITPGGVVSVSSGTSGLVNTLRAFDLPRSSYCLVASWTFVATAAAPLAAGLKPYFLDVDEDSWALTPSIAKKALDELDVEISAVITTSPFGAPVDTNEWDKFTEETGIPVIIDAASGFDSFSTIETSRPSNTPVMISLHATKLCGCGEGGIVMSQNANLIRKIKEISNFGFSGGREVKIPGTNGKISEYGAAIAHAALDHWPEKRENWISLRTKYSNVLNSIEGGIDKVWISETWAAATCNLRLSENNADEVTAQLNEKGIESRQWWGKGCHVNPAYAKYPQADLSNTTKLASSVIALPFSIDMSEEEINYVTTTLAKVLAGE
jgi:dTDP-4-amino-4,6-dideoxygalactose transaminase